ncbi:MAG: site-specific integrase [Oscillospiraceae bacterium]|jgi:integrase/recombinase XerD
MKGHFLTRKEIERFRNYLWEEEKSENTLEKYTRDVTAFSAFCDGTITKDTVIAYKQNLIDSGYAV